MRLIVAAFVLLAGCALTPSKPAAPPPLGPGEVRSAATAAKMLAIGKSTKSDVRAALGEGTVVAFPSGYDVWVYREAAPSSGELVLLFEPSGMLSKTRVR
jgi:hypothetical protein